MKSLSGGERSLSTLAFILALGTECESPFRAADEFDVFMDVREQEGQPEDPAELCSGQPETADDPADAPGPV